MLTRIPLLTCATAVLVWGGWQLSSWTPTAQTPAEPAAAPTAWTVGISQTFEVQYRAQTTLDIARLMQQPDAAPMTGGLRFAGVIGVADQGDGLLVSVESAQTLDVRLGTQQISEPTQVEGVHCLAPHTPTGLGALRCPAATPAVAHRALTAVVQDLFIDPRAGAHSRTTSLTQSTFEYVQAADRLVGERTAVHVNRVAADAPTQGAGTHVLHFDGGQLTRIEAGETLTLGPESTAEVEASAVRVGRQPMALVDATDWTPIMADAARRQRDALVQRMGDLTIEDAIDTLLTHGINGRVPDHRRWLYQVTGLLRLRPELCERFAQAALRAEMTPEGQVLALDVLANVGHGAALAGLRRILSETDSRGGAEWPRMVQSLMLAQQMDAETVAFLEETYDPSTAGGLAAANMLGVAASTASADEADRLVDLLAQGLSEDDAAGTAAHLTALGNTRHGEAARLAMDWLDASDGAIRHAAIRALRHHADDAEVRARLMSHLRGGASTDQHDALHALLRGGLQADEAARIGGLYETGQLDPGTAPLLMRALNAGALSGEAARGLIGQMQGQVRDPHVRARLIALRARLSSS